EQISDEFLSRESGFTHLAHSFFIAWEMARSMRRRTRFLLLLTDTQKKGCAVCCRPLSPRRVPYSWNMATSSPLAFLSIACTRRAMGTPVFTTTILLLRSPVGVEGSSGAR